MTNLEQVSRIKGLIKQAELENAKNQGMIESIKKKWMEELGTDDIEKVKEHLANLEQEKKESDERLDKLNKKLDESYDWDELEQELN